MPFPFTLPTTSHFPLTQHFESPSHPSLPRHVSTIRSNLRLALKTHKRLSATQQASDLPDLLSLLTRYIPALLSLDGGLGSSGEIDVLLTSTPSFEWRPTLTAPKVPGREVGRVHCKSLEFEIYFALLTLAYVHALLAKSALAPLYATALASPSPEQRTAAIQSATKSLLASAGITSYLSTRCDRLAAPVPALDVSAPVLRALTALHHAEATLLAVSKDDPYESAFLQESNKSDKEWMIRAPSIPKVRAHLFARLCLAAAGHADTAAALLASAGGEGAKGRIEEGLLGYVRDLRRVSRARACRWLGIDAEIGGRTGEGIAWLQGGLGELGASSSAQSGTSGSSKLLSRVKSPLLKDSGGKTSHVAFESALLHALCQKWEKENNMIGSQTVPDPAGLLQGMPSGRDMYTVSPWVPERLDEQTLAGLRAAPGDDGEDEGGSDSDEGGGQVTVGAFPAERSASSRSYF
jgi:hypothetical protein